MLENCPLLLVYYDDDPTSVSLMNYLRNTFNLVYSSQIGESAGAECKAVLQEVNGLVEQRLVSDSYAVKSLFGAANV